MNILYLEDSVFFQNIISEFVKEYSSIFCTDNEIIFKTYLNDNLSKIDIVLLDYIVKDIDVLELIQYIKKISFFIPIIILTGYGKDTVVVQCFKNGCNDYISKLDLSKELFRDCIFINYQKFLKIKEYV